MIIMITNNEDESRAYCRKWRIHLWEYTDEQSNGEAKCSYKYKNEQRNMFILEHRESYTIYTILDYIYK